MSCNVLFSGTDLWKCLDKDAEDARKSKNATADAIVEVQRYLSAPPLDRSQDPLGYWMMHKSLYPDLFNLANSSWWHQHLLCHVKGTSPKLGKLSSKTIYCGETIIFYLSTLITSTASLNRVNICCALCVIWDLRGKYISNSYESYDYLGSQHIL